MVNEVKLFESLDTEPLGLVCGGWMKREFFKINLHTAGELLARILDAATQINERDRLIQTARDRRTGLQSAFKLTVWFRNIYCEI
jgi:hypothetical protein